MIINTNLEDILIYILSGRAYKLHNYNDTRIFIGVISSRLCEHTSSIKTIYVTLADFLNYIKAELTESDDLAFIAALIDCL